MRWMCSDVLWSVYVAVHWVCWNDSVVSDWKKRNLDVEGGRVCDWGGSGGGWTNEFNERWQAMVVTTVWRFHEVEVFFSFSRLQLNETVHQQSSFSFTLCLLISSLSYSEVLPHLAHCEWRFVVGQTILLSHQWCIFFQLWNQCTFLSKPL